VVWHEVRLEAIGNDSWRGSFRVTELGPYEYTVEGWIDRFGSWLRGLIAKVEAGQDVSSELLEGAELIQAAATRDHRPPTIHHQPPTTNHQPDENLRLLEIADKLRGPLPMRARVTAARDPGLRRLMDARPDRSHATTYARVLLATVDPVVARFGGWYEMF